MAVMVPFSYTEYNLNLLVFLTVESSHFPVVILSYYSSLPVLLSVLFPVL